MSKTVRVITAIICVLALCVRVETQDVTRVFLPLVVGRSRDMGVWNVIDPTATENMTLNPSAETTGNFAAAAAGGVPTQDTTYSHFGSYSYNLTTAANNEGMTLTLSALSNAIHFVTMRIRGTLPNAWDWSLDNVAYTTPTLIEVFGDWTLYGLEFPAAQANASTTLYIHQNGAGAGDFNIDAVQVEAHDYWTTYCDGDQEGCEWAAAAHASASSRSVLSRAGGRVREFSGEWQFHISGAPGTGMAPVSQNVDEFAILPGGEVQSFKIRPRTFSLIGIIRGDSLEDVHANRQGLLDVLKPDAVPETDQGPQPVILRYKGATITKDISAHYESGLEFAVRAEIECWERVAIRFIADDPFFYQVGEESDPLDTEDPSITFRYVAGRLKDSRLWDPLGLAANPTTGGTITAIAVAPDKSVYVGGLFTGWGGIVGRDYIARYIPSTGAWETVGGASDLNGHVRALRFGPDGVLYVGGEFTDAALIPAADYIATWDGTNWAAVGVPVAGAAAINLVQALEFDSAGILYIGGNFTNWANDANADHIVSWNGAAYSALGVAGARGEVHAIAVDSLDNVFIGGVFAGWDGIPNTGRWAVWDGAAWASIGGISLNNVALAMAMSSDDILYVGGDFTDAGGNTDADYIFSWNGQAVSSLGTGMNALVQELHIAPDGVVYAGGGFTVAGDITAADRGAKWNGSSWNRVDIDFPGAPLLNAVATSVPDPVISVNYNIWAGYSSTGSGIRPGLTPIVNDGTESAFPRIVIIRVGASTGLVTFESVRNWSTGKELLSQYTLLEGETLTIDLAQTEKSVVSSFFGAVPGAIRAGSDFGAFSLRSGSNDVTTWVNTLGAPAPPLAITGFILWQETFWSAD